MMTIRVLVIDDSQLIRNVVRSALSQDPDIEVVGAAEDPIIARQMIKDLSPDVLTLDIEMPNMNGLDFLSKLMRLRPMPVVMVSTLTQKGANETLLALELGAVDFVAKPGAKLEGGIAAFSEEVRRKVKAAARADVTGRAMRAPVPQVKVSSAAHVGDGGLIAIGASTGGVDAIREVLTRLPSDAPPIVIAQHMPEGFTERFAQRLDELAPMKVVEAQDRMPIRRGHAYIAKGGFHLRIEKSSGEFKCRLSEDELVSGHRPSVDALFHSVAQVAGPAAVGAILTGMGKDGAQGLLAMRQAGSYTVGQSRDSALIYGMPRAAAEIGAVAEECAVERVAEKLLGGFSARRSAA
ncbi:MAG: chemotaxis response regulator protein-glutamate methylesterase [Hyphomicrobiaceae bacterium]|nr:chemotaxis response regulator protein-glutamate methylesterase [Hyphomicrobiaceae bacterium]